MHKAQVSWNRIKPLMKIEGTQEKDTDEPGNGSIGKSDMHDAKKNASEKKVRRLEVDSLGFGYPNVPYNEKIFEGISFEAESGQMIGVTGSVACGKSTFGKVFLCEYPYDGSIKVDGSELSMFSAKEQAGIVGYLGHDTELFADTIRNNILLGDEYDVQELLKTVCFDGEVAAMEYTIRCLEGYLPLKG